MIKTAVFLTTLFFTMPLLSIYYTYIFFGVKQILFNFVNRLRNFRVFVHIGFRNAISRETQLMFRVLYIFCKDAINHEIFRPYLRNALLWTIRVSQFAAVEKQISVSNNFFECTNRIVKTLESKKWINIRK